MSWTDAGTLEPSKKATTSKAGGRPAPQLPGVAAVALPAAAAGFVDLARLTRVTPSTPRSRDSSTATFFWPRVQPLSPRAGAEIAARTAEPPPDALDIEPFREVSVTSAGTTRETSRSACSQSKREDARSFTVWIRVSAVAWKSA